MRKIDARLRLFLRFVILAIVVATLAPTMLNAARVTTGANVLFAELCSSSGVRLLSVDGGDAGKQPAGGGMAAHGSHCVFCGSSVEPLTPSLPAPALQLMYSGLAYLPPLFSSAPRTLFIWAASQARAPPASQG